MWNRVALVASGFALGWLLVSYWTDAEERARTHGIGIALSLVVGALVAGWIGLTMPVGGLTGALAFLLTALVAYAGHARQIGKHEEAPSSPKPTRPARNDARTAVLLVSEGEPEVYTGPTFWAQRFQDMARAGERIPHWLGRPRVYARIRAAYRAMGGQNPWQAAFGRLAQALQGSLGEAYCVESAHLSLAPTLADALVHLVESGLNRFILVPVGWEEPPQETWRAQVAASRVREVGVSVTYVSSLDTLVWPGVLYGQRVRDLMRGQSVASPAEITPVALSTLRERVLAAQNGFVSEPKKE